MGERKVLNKYYPPDFDPAKVPKRKMPKDLQYTVRLMAPFNMRCINCGEYIYKGKKFNAKKETVIGETYLGLYIFRFYIRCTKCCNAITFKTDPKNTDYVCEEGATRNFENWREVDDDEEAEEKKAELEEQNPMAALEERTKESKAQMDILDALEEIKELSDKNATVDIDELIKAKEDAKEKILERRRLQLEADDDERARSVFANKKAKALNGEITKRLDSSDEDDDDKGLNDPDAGGGEAEPNNKKRKNDRFGASARLVKKPKDQRLSKLGIVMKSKQAAKPEPKISVQVVQPKKQQEKKPAAAPVSKSLGLGLDYGSSSESD